jgi:hypothetical protein
MIHPRLLEIADEAIKANIPVRVRILDFANPGLATGTVEALAKAGYQDGTFFLEVDGFYKNGSVLLVHNDHRGLTELFGRYDRLDFIGDENSEVGKFLAYNNHYQFKMWKDRGFSLDKQWIPLLVKHGILRPVNQTVYEDA